jgi:hypothetical protein
MKLLLTGNYEQSVKRWRIVGKCARGTTRAHGTYEIIHTASSVLWVAKKKRMAELHP